MRKRGRLYQNLLYQPIFDIKTYLRKVISVERQNLVGCWLQKESSGSISYDHSGNQYNGAYAGGLRLGQSGVPGMGCTSALFAEATANLLVNPRGGGALFGVADYDWSTTTVIEDNDFELGTAFSCVVDGAAGNNNMLTILTSGANFAVGQDYTVKVDIKFMGDAIGQNFNFFLYASTGGVAETILSLGDETTTGEVQTFYASGQIANADNTVMLLFLQMRDNTIGDQMRVSMCQVENKAYATPYCDGSLGTGFTWTGTPHASTSTRVATYNKIQSAGVVADFDGHEGTVFSWSKVANGAWTDAQHRRMNLFFVDANNFISTIKWNIDNRVDFYYSAGGLPIVRTKLDATDENFACWASSWSKSANGGAGEFIAYYNGEAVSTPLAMPNNFVGALTKSLIGSWQPEPSQNWSGWMGPTLLYNKALLPAQIAYLSTP